MMDYLKLFLGGLAFISLILVLIAIYARINDAQADEPMRDENPIDMVDIRAILNKYGD